MDQAQLLSFVENMADNRNGRSGFFSALTACALFFSCVSVQAGDDAGEIAAAAAAEARKNAAAEAQETQKNWARSVIGGALERAEGMARETAPGSPLPADSRPSPLAAERKSGAVMKGLAGRQGSAEVLVFMSLSVPPRSWEEWAAEAARAGAPLVLRGLAAGENGRIGSLKETVREVGKRLGGHAAGVAVDPRLFRLFGVERVPAVAVVPGGVPVCASRGCSEDPPPPHDLVGGNIGLMAALEAVAAEGGPGKETARVFLSSLAGAE